MPDLPYRTRFTLRSNEGDVRYIVLGTRSAKRPGGQGPACDDYELRRIHPQPLSKVYIPRTEVEREAVDVVYPKK